MSVHNILAILDLEFGILVFDGATEMFLILFVFVDSDIVVIQIDERSFFVGREEVILLFIVGSFKGLHRAIVEIWWAQVSSAWMACSQMFFQQ